MTKKNPAEQRNTDETAQHRWRSATQTGRRQNGEKNPTEQRNADETANADRTQTE
jgi:hypothetical protein